MYILWAYTQKKKEKEDKRLYIDLLRLVKIMRKKKTTNEAKLHKRIRQRQQHDDDDE